MRTPSLLLGTLALALSTISCSTGPTPPRPGTPAFYWNAAKDAYRTGDYQKTDQTLVEIIRTDSDLAPRARAWEIIMSAGLARGFSDMSESYEAGAKANRANPMPFHKQVTGMRSYASAAAMQLTESAHAFLEKDKDPNVLLAFEYPAGSAEAPGSLKKVAGGILIQDSERDSLQEAMLQRGVLLSLAAALGNGDDTAKTMEKFKAGEVRVPREVFLLAVAKALQERSELFGPDKLDQPNRMKLICQQATDTLAAIPQTKETKAIAAKIQAALKKSKIT
jgi:hypothetical protein